METAKKFCGTDAPGFVNGVLAAILRESGRIAPPMADLDQLTARLERVAAELRAGELDPEQAAERVDECARLAGEAAAELDRRARAGEAAPGQTELL